MITQTSSDSIKDNLNGILEWVKGSLESASSFAKEQVPIFIQEIITYYTFYYLIIASLLLITSVMFFIWAQKIRRYYANLFGGTGLADSKGADAGPGASSIPLYGVSLGTLIATIYHSIYLLKVTIAPRLYLLECVNEIIKSGGGG